MTKIEQYLYDEISNLSKEDYEKLKSKWLTRIYENKLEEDKLYMDFTNQELKALVRYIFKEEMKRRNINE